jgi:hypothetical protein
MVISAWPFAATPDFKTSACRCLARSLEARASAQYDSGELDYNQV